MGTFLTIYFSEVKSVPLVVHQAFSGDTYNGLKRLPSSRHCDFILVSLPNILSITALLPKCHLLMILHYVPLRASTIPNIY